ncbi:MAG: hypothetical protein ACD_76C00036G0002 [uncultured bacterium]|nr:MAG: hypothetical protein ACD_76C00036G0002 [uncultured bacterium]HBD05364.1 hypothetical protein [Candidatus Uhrbacteria bacterium]
MAFSKPTVGMRITDDSCELVSVSCSKNKTHELRKVLRIEIPKGLVENGRVKNSAELASAIKNEAEKNHFNSARVVLAFPDSLTYTHVFRFSGFAKDQDLLSLIEVHAQEAIPIDSDLTVADYRTVSRTRAGVDVLYAAALADDVEKYKEVLSLAGFKPAVFEPEALCIGRATFGAAEKKISLVADIESGAIQLLFFDAEGLRASFVKRVSELPVKKETAPYVDILWKNIQEAREWFEAEYAKSADAIVLTGELSDKKEIVSGIKKLAGDAVMILDHNYPTKQFASEDIAKLRKHGDMFHTSLGAAMNGCFPPLQTLNLLLPKIKGQGILERAGKTKQSKTEDKKSEAPVIINEQQVKSSGLRGLFASGMAKKAAVVFLTALIVVLVVLVIIPRLLPSASIFKNSGNVLQQAFLPIEQDFAFTVSPETGKADIIGRVVESEVIIDGAFVPATTESVIGKASGEVMLFNSSTTSQQLVARTRLLSDSGVLFRIQEDTTVPAAGQISVKVEADAQGQQGDIGPSRFTIPGLNPSRQAEIYGESLVSMTGGQSSVGILAQSDIDLAKRELLALAKEEETDIKQLLDSGELVLEGITEAQEVSLEVSAAVGDSVSSFNAILKVRLQKLVVKEKDIEEAGRAMVIEAYPKQANELEFADVVVEGLAVDNSSVLNFAKISGKITVE